MLGILTTVLGFGGSALGFITNNWKIVLGALVAGAIAWFAWSWYARGQDIERLEQEKLLLEDKLLAEKLQHDIDKGASEIIFKREIEKGKNASALDGVIGGAKNAPDKGITAGPATDSVLDDIERLRRDRANRGGNGPVNPK